jgi:hypothetical protein
MVPRAGGGQPGTPPVYVDIANWTRGFSFPGSFNLEPANAEEKLFLVFSLRGNGLPLDLTVSIQDVVRGHRTYQTAAGRSISLSSRDWVQYRIQLDPRENDFAGESPTPLVAGKANRISFMPPASWDAKIGNPVILGQKPFSLGPVTLERGTVTAKATQAITRQPDGVLNVDLEPFQTRVLVPR